MKIVNSKIASFSNLRKLGDWENNDKIQFSTLFLKNAGNGIKSEDWLWTKELDFFPRKE
jgi:hypothetical protein